MSGPPAFPEPKFPYNLLRKEIKFRLAGNISVEGVGTLLGVESSDSGVFLKVGQNEKPIYINTAHIASIEEKRD
jgi:hypothetical protein